MSEAFTKIEGLLAKGWDLTVSRVNGRGFHASVHLGRRHGPDSYHYIGNSVSDALALLERYIDEPEDSAVRRNGEP